MKNTFLITLSCFICITVCYSQNLTIIHQDYNKALKTAKKENKLLFVDFYTNWCAPCKKLDKLVFQNDSIQEILTKDFVLLKYNAENDTIYHLSKKYHVMSYPTAITLNSEGYVVNRKYGFPGDDFNTLTNNIIEFTTETTVLNQQKHYIKGYSNTIDPSVYPEFYTNYVNRANTKVNPEEFQNYWNTTIDPFSEAYFTTLIYFASDPIPDHVIEILEKYKSKYIALYGTLDVNILFYFLSTRKFKDAIAANDQETFDEAVSFITKNLGEKYNGVTQAYQKEFLMANNKWEEVHRLNTKLKKEGNLSDGAINNYCWKIYKDCDTKSVIQDCINWMKELTDKTPEYAYLDTYAYLLFKLGNHTEARKIAQKGIEIGKTNHENIKSTEKLLEQL